LTPFQVLVVAYDSGSSIESYRSEGPLYPL